MLVIAVTTQYCYSLCYVYHKQRGSSETIAAEFTFIQDIYTGHLYRTFIQDIYTGHAELS